MASQMGGDRLDTVIKLVLIFFISLASFSVGTFVGKGVSDSEYRQAALERGEYWDVREPAQQNEAMAEGNNESTSDAEISSLTEEFLDAEKRSVASEDGELKKVEPAHEKESLQPKTSKDKDGYVHFDKKTVAAPEAQGAKEAPKAAKETPAKEQPKQQAKHEMKAMDHEKIATSNQAKRVAEGKAPMVDQKAPRAPNATLPPVASSSIGKYTVQVASYAEETEARTYAADLKSKGLSAFYVTAKVQDKTWYRVSVGLFTDYKHAATYRAELKEKANISSAIVQKIVE